MRYFDTGILLKLYLSEPNSAQAVALVQERDGDVPHTSLHRLEMKAAIMQKHGRGEITELARDAVLADLEMDISTEFFTDPAVAWPGVFARAESLAVAHAGKTLCRSLDTLHVALALELGAKKFFTFDARQSEMAKAAGLVVVS